MANAPLLSEIKNYLALTGMSPTYFGRRSVNNCRLVERLEGGKRVWPDTELRVRAYMLAHAPSKTPAEDAA